MYLWLGCVVFVACLAGCERNPYGQVDELLFTGWGRTVLTHPGSLSLKEIHLGPGSYGGESVIVEGKLVELSRHGTYAIISDDEARLLVVLTDMLEVPVRADGVGGSVRFLGTLERGRKGLPLLRARAISLRSPPSTVAAAGKA